MVYRVRKGKAMAAMDMPDDALRIENTCTLAAIRPTYAPLIRAAVAAYHAIFTDQVEEVRLMGSVARGEAMPGRSDIDFLALVREVPTDAARAALNRHAMLLGRTYPIVSLVDLEVSRLEDLYPVQRFILTSDSIAVAGDDRLTLRSQTVSREALIRLVTPSMSSILSDYHTTVTHLDPGDGDQLRFYSRIIGKDLLKCLRGVILRRGDTYERNIGAIAAQALAHFPEHSMTIAMLYQCYSAPTSDRTTLLRTLADATGLPR
jgi:predicted nucleotidyltransferase